MWNVTSSWSTFPALRRGPCRVHTFCRFWYLIGFDAIHFLDAPGPLHSCSIYPGGGDSVLVTWHRYRKRNPMQPGCLHIRILTAHVIRLTEAHVQVSIAVLQFRFACDICSVGQFSPKRLFCLKIFAHSARDFTCSRRDKGKMDKKEKNKNCKLGPVACTKMISGAMG